MRRSVIGAVVFALFAMLQAASSVAAFPLTNCLLGLESHRADGGSLDTAQSGAPDATQADPFMVDWDGTVAYQGASDVAMENDSWAIALFGIPTPLQGGDDNPADDRMESGTVGDGANAPFRLTGLYFVSGSLSGNGGTCAGSGWFKLAGDPVGTLPFWAGLGLLTLGLGLLLLGARGHVIWGVVGGLLVGLGAVDLLVIFSTLPLGSPTVPLTLALGLIVGIVVGILGRRSRRNATGSAPASTPV
jgi:hypothetical protein